LGEFIGRDTQWSRRVREAHTAAAKQLADLQLELDAIAESTAEIPDDEHDAEGSTVGYERARVSALAEESRRTLGALDDATRRLGDGTYGRCANCGRAITPERLDALPATNVCAQCSGAQRSHRR